MTGWSWDGWEPRLFSKSTLARMRRNQITPRPMPDEPCCDCGLPHTPERRLAILRRCVGMEPAEIAVAYSHIWPAGDSGHRMLMRDLAALRGAK